jgi:predicted translin family RNA/ssDNA-binding protein
MQLAIELPEEVGEELYKHQDVQAFVLQAIKKMLLEEKQASQLLTELVHDLPEFPGFANQDPLALQKTLRDEWR